MREGERAEEPGPDGALVIRTLARALVPAIAPLILEVPGGQAAQAVRAGADIRWVRDQMVHASIGETEGTYGHLVREHHERDVDALDVAFRAAMTPDDGGGTPEFLDSRGSAASHCVPPQRVSR